MTYFLIQYSIKLINIFINSVKNKIKKNQIEYHTSNRGFIYLKNQIKEKGEHSIFFEDRRWDDSLDKYISYKFPFKISNQSLAKTNRKIIVTNEKNGKVLELRIKRIFYPAEKRGFGAGAIGYSVTVEKMSR
jgi:hypothetical protein